MVNQYIQETENEIEAIETEDDFDQALLKLQETDEIKEITKETDQEFDLDRIIERETNRASDIRKIHKIQPVDKFIRKWWFIYDELTPEEIIGTRTYQSEACADRDRLKDIDPNGVRKRTSLIYVNKEPISGEVSLDDDHYKQEKDEIRKKEQNLSILPDNQNSQNIESEVTINTEETKIVDQNLEQLRAEILQAVINRMDLIADESKTSSEELTQSTQSTHGFPLCQGNWTRCS